MKIIKRPDDDFQRHECAAILTPATREAWYYSPDRNPKCRNRAKYRVDVIYLCRKHASMIVLDLVVEKGEI